MKHFIFAICLGISNIAIAKEQFKIDRDLWLKAHNDERELVGVLPLVWDIQLKMRAKRWAVKLLDTCPDKKLHLRHSPDRGDIGENIAGSWGRKHTVDVPVNWWIKEKDWYDANKHECNAPEGRSCGHYTQVVSKRSKTIGCAVARCKGTDNITYYVCNYAPHGNMIGVNPF